MFTNGFGFGDLKTRAVFTPSSSFFSVSSSAVVRIIIDNN